MRRFLRAGGFSVAPLGAKSIAIIMGSQSDWQTMKHAADTLDALGVPYEARIVSLTSLPVFGVPIESKALSGLDSLYSIVQMPPGVPVGTLAIGPAGAVNAALLAASVLALSDPTLGNRLEAWRQRQTESVAEQPKDGA
jgi:5-(carboxyamino)imidazole ribonucleotide mutase